MQMDWLLYVHSIIDIMTHIFRFIRFLTVCLFSNVPFVGDVYIFPLCCIYSITSICAHHANLLTTHLSRAFVMPTLSFFKKFYEVKK